MTLEAFGDLFGLSRIGERSRTRELRTSVVWGAITGFDTRHLKNLLISRVQSPAIRIWLKFMAMTVTARRESNRANSTDLQILARFLRPGHGPSISLPETLLYTLKSYYEKSPITFGGLITHVAAHFDLVRPPTAGRTVSTLDIKHLANSSFLDGSGWKILNPDGTSRTIPMPTAQLPRLAPDLPDYLFAAAGPPVAPLGDNPPPPPVTHQYSRRRPRVEPTPPEDIAPDVEVPAPDRYDTLLTAIEGIQASIRTIQEDQRRALYPIYDYYYRLGVFPQGLEHPSWFLPPASGTLGGSSDPGAGPSHRGTQDPNADK